MFYTKYNGKLIMFASVDDMHAFAREHGVSLVCSTSKMVALQMKG